MSMPTLFNFRQERLLMNNGICDNFTVGNIFYNMVFELL